MEIVYTASISGNSNYSIDGSYNLTQTEVQKRSLTVAKRIKASDIYWEHGTPSFMINLTGTDKYGNEVSRHKMLTFDRSYVEAHTDSDGYAELEAVFDWLQPGTYTASEEESVSRYKRESIDKITNGTANNTAGTVAFNLTTNKTGYARYTNKVDNYDKDSSKNAVTNTANATDRHVLHD